MGQVFTYDYIRYNVYSIYDVCLHVCIIHIDLWSDCM